MGEFSLKNLDMRNGLVVALIAAGSSIVLPIVLFLAIKSEHLGSLTHHDVLSLDIFVISAVIIGAVVTSAIYLYCGYPAGTKSRLLMGILSGALLAAYSFVALLASGLNSVIQDIGIRLDLKYVAVMVAYGSVPLVFIAAVGYLNSRKEWLESLTSIQTEAVRSE